ncbi:uncharacterized protein UHOD_20303 [Ustilago sp. UG-2017b]|nr:uncharacterized protein UHOD_20303 [Ustilago sp. UG-2017b]
MRFSRHATKLVLLLVAFAAAASALVLPNSANDIHNSDRGAKLIRRQGPRWSWQELYDGQVRHNPEIRPMHRVDGYFINNYFHKGKPLFIYYENNRGGVDRFDAWHALTNYKGFHAYQINSRQAVTVLQDKTVLNDVDVANFGKDVNWVNTQFGEIPSKLALGSNVNPLRKKTSIFKWRSPKVPTWDDVMTTRKANLGHGLENLKPILDDQRKMRFVDQNGAMSLNIRAHPDGQVEYQVVELLSGLRKVIRGSL